MENDSLATIPFYIKLNNGYDIPIIGMGTSNQQDLSNIIYESIKDGLRSIDTASIYRNEREVGEGINRAINDGIVKREELFIVTKLWITDKHQPEESIKKQLKELNLDYVDLYLDHWPISIYKIDDKMYRTPIHQVWKNMENLVKKGYTKSIGVSNYSVQILMDLLTYCEIKPVVNQVEYHPYLHQANLHKYCMDNGIYLIAYNSLTKGAYTSVHSDKNLILIEEPLIKNLATKYNKTPGQICLNWALVQKVFVIPATSNSKRMKENLNSLSFKLSNEDMNSLKSLNIDFRFLSSTQYSFCMGYDIFA
jgi:diketogulonate reductase-like aldo/keto reductase